MTFWNTLNNFDKVKGDDYTKEYVKNKNAYFYINREGSANDLIVFKPFLTDLSYDLKLTTEPNSDAVTNSNPSQVIKESTITMKIGLNVPATSLSEAYANREKVSKLMTWQRDPKKVPVKVGSSASKTNDNCDRLIEEMKAQGYKFNQGKLSHDKRDKLERLRTKKPQQYKQAKVCAKQRFRDKRKGKSTTTKVLDTAYRGENMVFRISFANLIQSGKYDNEKQILSGSRTRTDQNLANYALRCFLSNVTVDVDMDMGFFEDDDGMVPKAYKISFDVDILNRFESGVKLGSAKGGPFKNILGFYESQSEKKTNLYGRDNYHEHDSKYWPFGIRNKPTQSKFNNSIEAAYTGKSKNKIQFKKYSHTIEFYPFISKLSVVRKIDSKGMQEFKHLTGKDRIVYDTKMPSYSLGFTTAAINVAHSRQILYNYQKLMRMIYPTYIPGDTSFAYLFVRVGNLIGSGTQFFDAKGFVRCICNSLTIKPNLDFGFFEQGGMLFPKNFDISLTLEVNDPGFGA